MAEKINIGDLMTESYSDKTLKAYSGIDTLSKEQAEYLGK